MPESGAQSIDPRSATIVTHADMPGGAPDDRILADALRARGFATRFAVWNDPGVDWCLSAVTIVRSTWDYHRHPQGWADWVSNVARLTTLVNQPALLRWNADKRYLRELAEQGVACVPTEFVDTGAETLAAIAARRGWSDVIVKPAIAASAFGVGRFADAGSAAAEGHLQALLSRGTALVQPYLGEVETVRERSLVVIAASVELAFTKPSFSTIADGKTALELHEPDTDEVGAAMQALSALAMQPLFARVDLLPSAAGPLLMELELIEPDLGLRLAPNVADRFADALLAWPRRA